MGSRNLLEFLIYSNVYLAIGAGIVSLSTAFIFNFLTQSDIFNLFFIPFSASFFIYNLNRFTDRNEDNINVPERTRFIEKNGKGLISIAALCYIVGIFIAFSVNYLTGTIAIIPGISALIYSKLRVKKAFFIKNLLVALNWALSSLIVGAYYSFTNEIFLSYGFFFIAFLINVIIFDIKDVIGDSASGIITLPARWGVRATKAFCMVLFLVLLSIFAFLLISSLKSVVLIPFLVYIFLYVLYARRKERMKWWYYGGFVDGEFLMILIAMLAWVVLWA